MAGIDCQLAAFDNGPITPTSGALSPASISLSTQSRVTTVSLFNRIAYSAVDALSPMFAALV
jgi:hypothetical protein